MTLKKSYDLAAILRVTPALAIKAATEAGAIEGYGSTFGGEPDAYGDIIAAGAFSASLARHKAEGSAPVMLWAHKSDQPIGRWTELREDSRGLYVRGMVNLQSDRGREAHAHLKAGDVNGFSIGYTTAAGGAVTNQDGTQTLKTIDLMEISVVAVPANRFARVTEVKNLSSQIELEQLLRHQGLPRGAAVKLAAGGWPALSNEPDDNPQFEQLLARIKAATLDLKKG